MFVLIGPLVLNEILWLLGLSDVMIVRANTCQQGVLIDGLGGGLCQVPDDDAVVVGTRGSCRPFP